VPAARGALESNDLTVPTTPTPRRDADPDRSVLMIASEAQPFAKSGGLADVLGALPIALGHLGWNVTVVLPKYRGVTAGALVERFPIAMGGYPQEVGCFDAPIADGVRAILIDCPDLYDRETLYGPNSTDYPDNPRRFAMLCRAALEFVRRGGRRVGVVHVHDWQAGLAPVYLKAIYAADPVLGGTPSVLTIHNLAYQGNFAPDWLPRLDLGWDQLAIERMEYWGRVSFLKGGINNADWLTTVSPRYAEEVQTREGGFGFDGIISARRDRFVGILNGIDVTEWDPSRDRFLPEPFTASDLSGKRAAKAEILTRYGLSADAAALDRPLIGMVSRMVDQKGLDLIAALARDLPRLGAAFVVLGEGAPVYERLWTDMAAANPGTIGVRVGFDESLAHLIEGGADMFLMPSRFEPCGLNQLYSLRYGTIPIVHAVGGLADTVRDSAPGVRKANGFVFRQDSPAALLDALTRALAAFRDSRRWGALQRTGMAEDHSWDRSAAEYVKIYDRALGRGTKPVTAGRRPRSRSKG